MVPFVDGRERDHGVASAPLWLMPGYRETVRLRQHVRRALAPVPGAEPTARLVVETFLVCFRHRVTGLSAEAAFFTLLSMPPLILGLIAGVGFLGDRVDPMAIGEVSRAIEVWAGRFLTPDVVEAVIMPTVTDTLRGGRADLLSIGFLLALWAGSRALHVFLDAIVIMYGQTGVRGIVRSRVVSLSLYLVSILLGSIIFPLVLIGPELIAGWLPPQLQPLNALYWPVVGLSGLVALTGLFHFATPERSPFFRDLPGAVLAVAIWVLASAGLRTWAGFATGGPSLFGPLSAPIVVLIWFYLLALAVLVGAALNASIRRLWPPPEYRGPVVRAGEWWTQVRARSGAAPLTPVEREPEPAPEEVTTRPREDLEAPPRVG